MKNEIGRELKWFELKPGTVVAVKPPGWDLCATFWVTEVSSQVVVFYSGAMSTDWHVINFVTSSGSLVDDQGRNVKVFEYLGEV